MNLATQFQLLTDELNKTIIGQEHLVKSMLLALLSDGHILVEGPPGLAKTKAIKTLASFLEGKFHRIQFTPDLLPSDITGTEIYRQETGLFEFQAGPIFNNLILADEINRAPAKVQSALLEAMAEGQVSVGQKTLQVEKPFMVMATQNPLDQEGTYPLPEAQLDRFMLHVNIDYPKREDELKILERVEKEEKSEVETLDFTLNTASLFAAREEIMQLQMHESVKNYLVELVIATREPAKYSNQLAELISYGASPRATLALAKTARANAWLQGKDFVSPDDVKAVVKDVLRHRIVLSYTALGQGKTPDAVIDELLNWVTLA